MASDSPMKVCGRGCENDKSIWTKVKLMAFLKKIVHKDVFDNISRVDVQQFTSEEKFGIDVVWQFLDHLSKLPETGLQMYCNPSSGIDGLIFDLNNLDSVPLVYKYVGLARSDYYFSEPSISCKGRRQKADEPCSKVDVVLMLYHTIARLTDQELATKLCNPTFDSLETVYEMIPRKVADSISFMLENAIKMQHVFTIIEINNQTFKPFKCVVETEKMKQLPYVRMFDDKRNKFCLAAEVEVAIMIAFNNRFPNGKLSNSIFSKENMRFVFRMKLIHQFTEKYHPLMKQFTDWNIQPEHINRYRKSSIFVRRDNQKDRQLGILHIVEKYTFEDLLHSLNLTEADVLIVETPIGYLGRGLITIPIVSFYGSHCKLAFDAWTEFLDNITMELRLFQRVKKSNLSFVDEWFNEKIKEVFDSNRGYRYLVETWKVDEMIERARVELEPLLTEPVYNIPTKLLYNKKDVFTAINNFSPVLDIKQECIKILNEDLNSKQSLFSLCRMLFIGTQQFLGDTLFHNFKVHQRLSLELFYDTGNHEYVERLEKIMAMEICFRSDWFKKEMKTPPPVRKTKKNKKPVFSQKFDEHEFMKGVLQIINKNHQKLQDFKLENLEELIGDHDGSELRTVLLCKINREKVEKFFDIKEMYGKYSLSHKTTEFLTSMVLENLDVEKRTQEKIEKLENDLKAKEIELETMAKKKEDVVQQSVEKVRRAKEEAGSEIAKMQEKLENFYKQIGEAEKNHAAKMANLKQLSRDNLNQEKKVADDNKEKFDQSQKELRSCRKELKEEKERKYNETDKDLKTATEKIKKLETQLENFKLLDNTQKKEVLQLKEKIEESQVKIEMFESQVNKDEAYARKLEAEEKDTKIEELHSKIDYLTTQLQEANMKIEEMTKNLLPRSDTVQ